MTKKIALIGVGAMAGLHAHAVAQVDGIEFISCASRSIDKAEVFAREHNISVARTIDDTLAKPDADALWVVAPAHIMADVAKEYNRLSLPLFLEKPIGLSLDEARSVAGVLTVPHMIGLNRRFYSTYKKAMDLLDAAGGIRAIEVHLTENPQALKGRLPDRLLERWEYANSIHMIDLFRFFCGEPKNIQTFNVVNGLQDRNYHAHIDFESGAAGIYNAQWYAPSRWRLMLYGNDVTVECQPAESAVVYGRESFKPVPIEPDETDVSCKPGLVGQATAFRDFLNNGQWHSAAVQMDDYVKSVALVEALGQ